MNCVQGTTQDLGIRTVHINRQKNSHPRMNNRTGVVHNFFSLREQGQCYLFPVDGSGVGVSCGGDSPPEMYKAITQ